MWRVIILSVNLKNILDNYVKEIKKIFGASLIKIILYGSYARGDNRENSDIDIMILVALDNKEIKGKMNELAEVSFEYDISNNINISPLVTNIEQYNRCLSAVPFYKNIENEGVILNG